MRAKKEVKKVEVPAYLAQLTDPQRFFKRPDGWVRDNLLGLDWGPSSDKYMTFKEAEKFCKEQGGRLPELRELHSLVDYSKRDPAIDKNIFPDTQSRWYWTATPVAGLSSFAWCVGFGGGGVLGNGKGSYGYVRPVRASQ